MGQVSKVLRDTADNGLVFWCPGCDMAHRIQHGAGSGPRWTWNGDVDRPTFSPSVLVQWEQGHPPVTPENLEQWRTAPWPQTNVPKVCHSFVTDGRIQFLGSSYFVFKIMASIS